MVVRGHRNKFYHLQQVKLISILENERAIVIEYSFHWQWWDIFPLLISGAGHRKVDILSSPLPSPHCMKRNLKFNLRDSLRLNLKDQVWLKELSLEPDIPQHYLGGHSNTGIRYGIKESLTVPLNYWCPICTPKRDGKHWVMGGKFVAQGSHPLPSLSATAPFPTGSSESPYRVLHRIKDVCHHPTQSLKSRRLPLNI